MQKKKRFAYHQSQHCVAKKLQALVVANARSRFLRALRRLPACRTLVRQRTVSQGAHKQFSIGKDMPECSFEFRQNCFHMRLDQFDFSRLPLGRAP